MARRHQVADFNTIDDLTAHAARELGATHVLIAGPETRLYFPRGGQYPYEEARVRRSAGYWHAEGPGARSGVSHLPSKARPIAPSGRRAAETPQPSAEAGADKLLKKAKSAGEQYARDQIESDHFQDWVRDQIYEASRMDPSQVLPLETKDDAKVIAENMLQQLGWDTKRELATFEILKMIGESGDTYIIGAFYEGFDEALHDPNVVDWLADEILFMHAQTTGRTAEGAREARRGSSIQWVPSGGGTGWHGRGPSGRGYLLRRAGKGRWNLHIEGRQYGPFDSLEAAKAEAEQHEQATGRTGEANVDESTQRRLERLSPEATREGLYGYRGASVELSGPAGGRWLATVRFRHQETDFEGRSAQEVIKAAMDWVDQAPELRGVGEARKPRKRTGVPVRYKHDLWEVLAWDGDWRTRDQMYGYASGKQKGVFWTQAEAKAFAEGFMQRNKPLSRDASVRISETLKSGDTYWHELWGSTDGTTWTFIGTGKYAGTHEAPNLRETPYRPSDETPPKKFKSQGGRAFTVRSMKRIPPRFEGDSFWKETWPIFYKGKLAGKLFRSGSYRAPLEWHATIRELYWEYAPGAPPGIGFDVAAYATPQETLESWGRSADQILDWSEGKPVHTLYKGSPHQKKSQRKRSRKR